MKGGWGGGYGCGCGGGCKGGWGGCKGGGWGCGGCGGCKGAGKGACKGACKGAKGPAAASGAVPSSAPVKIPAAVSGTLINTAVDLIGEASTGFLEGPTLATKMRQRCPNEINSILGSDGSVAKGWLRALFTQDPSKTVVPVKVPGKLECWTLQGFEPAAAAAEEPPAKKPRTEGPQGGCKGKGKGKDFGGKGFGGWGGWGFPGMGMWGMMNPMAAMMACKGKGKASKERKRPELPEGLLDSVPNDGDHATTLVEAAIAIISHMDDFVEGSRLSLLLMDAFPEAVKAAKEASPGKDGKGWLKATLEAEPRLANVKVTNRNEPCFCLAEKAPESGIVELAAGKTSSPPNVQAFMNTPEGEAAATAFFELACQVLEEPEFLEGSALVKHVNAVDAEALTAVRTGMKSAKGWLKAIVANEPRIAIIEVGTRNEPCYRLASKGEYSE